ncbi:Flagellar L-ring protein precursor [Planctomycetes bacterium Pla163]|uniref:Flagellar L-ring protein n=1 Tax=Rohdeia mirabilis TaxID=2528008 RepID=A0A518D502_9BACT|nr:Flagellar L-ring protein precursor [Planctomycetes bacterium Pla163]
MRNLLSLLLTVLVAGGACAIDAAAQNRPGSLYNTAHGPVGLIQDKTARRIGDLVTVVIVETADVSSEDSADTSKSTSLNYEMTNFDIKPDAFSLLPSLGANSSDSFSGSSQVDKRDSFEARITAMVVDVLPNGNMVISGRRELRIENQVKLIEFSGVVRRYDIASANTVPSALVADARISYVGAGPATVSTQRTGLGSWIYNALDWLWPF